MNLVIASGKGGTGKTTLAVNLAAALADERTVGLLDCDVEEPDCHLFLRPQFAASEPVMVMVPEIAEAACSACGLCARACEFNALVALPGTPLLLPELCHSCGTCAFVCPEEAIAEGERAIGALGSGSVDIGLGGRLYFRWGSLKVGEARSAPLVRAVKQLPPSLDPDLVVVDAPPGVACPTVEAMRDADLALLVTEPTPFGLSDLRAAVGVTRWLGIPAAVVVNRADLGDKRVQAFCLAEEIPVVPEIPYDERLALASSRGEIFALEDAGFAGLMHELMKSVSLILENRSAAGGRAAAALAPGAPAALAAASPASAAAAASSGPEEGRGSDQPIQLVVLSGKGGAGKTTITAAFASLAEQVVLADCDVDAANLYLVLDPVEVERGTFVSGRTAYIDPQHCSGCGACAEKCRFGAIAPVPSSVAPTQSPPALYRVDPLVCEGCALCSYACTCRAVEMQEAERGEWFVSETRCGPLVHARLGIGGENSGKLVTQVREKALSLAEARNASLLLIDGPPGIGCPAIASVAGADFVLLVTEPTVSGSHDLFRAVDLVEGFRIPLAVCVNKCDINPELTTEIERACLERGIPVIGRLSYDNAATAAQTEGKTVVEKGGRLAQEIEAMWNHIVTHVSEGVQA